MRRRCAALAVVGMSAITACSGSDDAAPTSTVALTAASTTPATTEASSTTTAAPTTAAPTTAATTTAPATVPPTTPAPVTTAPLDLAAAVQRDASEAELALLTAIGAPGDAASRSLVERYYAGDSLARVIEALDFLVENGLIGAANPEVPSVLLVLDTPTLEPGSTTEAQARTCRVDAAVITRLLNDDPNGPSAVYNDRITRTVAMTRFSLANGVWRVAGGTTLDETIGETSCDGV